MLLSEHVAVVFKMTELVEQRCVKFEHFSAETIRMIQKAAATGNW